MIAKQKYDSLPDVVTELPVGIPGMSAKLVARNKHKAIYYRWDDVWEVFRIKKSKVSIVFGKEYPAREVYPGNEDFGSTAWCFKDEKLAWKRYNAL